MLSSAESFLSCALSSRQWTYSKEKLIDESSRNSSKDWSGPVHLPTSLTFGNKVNLILDAHPVVVPLAHHWIGPKGTGRVHAAASLIWRWTLWDDSNPVRGTKYFFLKMVFVRWFKPGSSERDGKKVAGCDGQSNSKRCRALWQIFDRNSRIQEMLEF